MVKTNELELTATQAAYLMGRNEFSELGGTCACLYYEFTNRHSITEFKMALNKVIKNQSMLRAIVSETGRLTILESVPEYVIETYDLSKMEKYMQEKFISDIRAKMSNSDFPLNKWPMFDIKAAVLSESKNYYFLCFDSLIADGNSIKILIDEIHQCNRLANAPLPLKKEFYNYVIQQQEITSTDRYKRDKAYWVDKMDEIPVAPKIYTSIFKEKNMNFKRLSIKINANKWTRIKSMADKKDISPTTILLTAYAYILEFWSGQPSFTINTTFSDRDKKDEDIQRVIGNFTQSLLVPLSEEKMNRDNFWKTARIINNVYYRSYKHRLFDGMEVIKELARTRNLGISAVMPIVFTSMLSNDLGFDSIADFGQMQYVKRNAPQVYLDFQAMELSGELHLIWDYIEEAFDEYTILFMMKNYLQLITELNDKGSIDSSLFSLPDSHLKVINSYNNTYIPLECKTLGEMVGSCFTRYADKNAMTDSYDSITYHELNYYSSAVGERLLEEGVKPGEFIGIYGDKRISTIINILAVVRIGAVIVPVDPTHPQFCREYILNNTGCKRYLEPFNYKDIAYDSKLVLNGFCKTKSADTAYIVYTSGSNGKLKGVQIPHYAACNTIIDVNKRLGVSQWDVLISLSPLSSDLLIYDLFGSLSSGARLILINDQHDMTYIMDILNQEPVTIWNSVPMVMELLLSIVDENYLNEKLRTIILSGDSIPVTLPEKIMKHFPQAKLYCMGGAAEASIWSIYYPIEKIDPSWESIPYGYPLTNHKLYVLDHRKEYSLLDTKGEIYIGGLGLADGYLNNYIQTHLSFIEHKTLGRLFRTGNYGILRKSGYIEFYGRDDS